jgi:Cu2+-exporting ATPase
MSARLPSKTDSTGSSSTRTAPAAAACTHCGLPVPAGLIVADRAEQFCCTGCHAVHDSLHACGLEKYYELAAKESVDDARPAQVTHRRFAHLDRPEFLAKHARVVGEGRMSVELRVDGLRCGACMWLLEALPRIVRGLIAVRVDLGRGAVVVDWNPDVVTLGAVARRFDGLGYQLLPLSDPEARQRDRAFDRAWVVRIGVAAVLASNAMAVGFALYGHVLHEMSAGYRLFFQWVSVALAVAALAWPGRIFFVNAWTALRARTPHMDLPVATGLFAATLAGTINTIIGSGWIYCESATALVFLLLVGRFVQYRQQRKARQEVELITSLVPSIARKREKDGATSEVPIDVLVAGDIVEVTAGEIVPCDGALRWGSARFDCSLLTGESRAQTIAEGDPVFAGTRPIDRPIDVIVEKAGAETRAGRLLALVNEASSRRPPIVELADRMSGWFLAAVLAGALVTTLWWWHLGADVAIGRAVAFLVVTCPCALGLATPLAVVAGIGKAARRGVLIKGGDVLERLASRGTIVLDKTGTLTEGRIAVTTCEGDVDALAMAAAVERSSGHPIAKAVVEAFGRSPETGTASDVVEHMGIGIEGRVDGRRIAVGSERLMRLIGVVMPIWASTSGQRIAERGESPIFVAVDGELQAMIAVGDPIRPEAAVTIGRLREAGWSLAMASGDHPLVARAVGAAVGLRPSEIHGGCTPEMKLAFVRDGHLRAPVVMVGDGVNDLAAMAAADVGVAVRNGAQSALHVADACLAAGGLVPLQRLVAGSRRTMFTIKVNLVVSVAYNLLGGVLAFAGLVNPLVAAILMPVSSLTVVALAVAMPHFEIEGDDDGRGRKER